MSTNVSNRQKHSNFSFHQLPVNEPFHPKSDQHLISPYNITPESNVKVTRVKETNNDYQQKGLLTVKQIPLVRTLGNVQRTVRRTCLLIMIEPVTPTADKKSLIIKETNGKQHAMFVIFPMQLLFLPIAVISDNLTWYRVILLYKKFLK